jgi:hypothetical protein
MWGNNREEVVISRFLVPWKARYVAVRNKNTILAVFF